MLALQVTDVFDRAKRSHVMAGIRGRGNRSTELAMARLLRAAGIVGWRRHLLLRPKVCAEDVAASVGKNSVRIATRPDFAFRSSKLALFIDGCFWHGCALHSTAPVQNAKFWSAKLSANMLRDGVQTRALEQAGWTVIRIWEHELIDPDLPMKRLLRCLRGTSAAPK